MRTIKLLFSGHDLKFLRNIIPAYQNKKGYDVLIEEHKGHVPTDTGRCETFLKKADIVFCEWCLGNAVWYSHNLKPHQKLIIRVHHQEMKLPYRYQLAWENVNNIIFTGYFHFNNFKREQPEHADKARLIFCDVKCDDLFRTKFHYSEFNLGLVGINPMRKRPDLAIEILYHLKKIDSRFTLFFKTRMPWEYDWLWKREEERAYYNKMFEDLKKSTLQNSVVFDMHGDNMTEWYSKIGWILSTSDHEGSHQAVAEGMASGAIPIIRNWDGAYPLYPKNYVFSTIEEAVNMICEYRKSSKYHVECSNAYNYTKQNFDTPIIVNKYDELISSLTEDLI